MKPYEEKMKKTMHVLETEYASMRAGRANPAVLDRITAEYYGSPTPINQLASVSVSEARILVVQPYDKSVLKAIEKAIQTSELGINPSNDGTAIRLNFPQLTEERRRELGKGIRKQAEEAKVAIRSIRRDANDKFKALKKTGDVTEDELKIVETKMQKSTEKFCDDIDKLSAVKEKEIMEV